MSIYYLEVPEPEDNSMFDELNSPLELLSHMTETWKKHFECILYLESLMDSSTEDHHCLHYRLLHWQKPHAGQSLPGVAAAISEPVK